MVPGMSLILVGQCLFQRINSRKENEEKRSIELMRELKEIQIKLEDR
jgi:hypothetical protein